MPINYTNIGSASLYISKTQQAGYTLAEDITPRNAGPFYYKYTGGNARGKAENVGEDPLTDIGDFEASAPSTFTVALETTGYHIHDVRFSGSGNSDMSFTRNAEHTIATVTDSYRHPATSNDYCLKIKDESDTHGNTFFKCDPRIVNK